MKRTYDAILLLGLELTKDSQPRPELIVRIEEAAKAYHEGLLGENGVLIPCGGVLPGRTRSEAEVMAAELEARGVPREKMRLEDKSQVTIENMRLAARILENPQKARVLVITSDYHIYRSYLDFVTVSEYASSVYGTPEIRVVSHACCDTWNKRESLSSHVADIAYITGVTTK